MARRGFDSLGGGGSSGSGGSSSTSTTSYRDLIGDDSADDDEDDSDERTSSSDDPFGGGQTGSEAIDSGGDSSRADSTADSGDTRSSSGSQNDDPQGSDGSNGGSDPFGGGQTGSEVLGSGGDDTRAEAGGSSSGSEDATSTPGGDRLSPENESAGENAVGENGGGYGSGGGYDPGAPGGGYGDTSEIDDDLDPESKTETNGVLENQTDYQPDVVGAANQIEENIAEEYGITDRRNYDITFEDGEFDVEFSDAARGKIRAQQIAEQNPDIDRDDLEIRPGGRVVLTDDARARERAESVSDEDLPSDGRVSIQVAEANADLTRETAADLRREVASQNEEIDPDELEIVQNDEGVFVRFDARPETRDPFGAVNAPTVETLFSQSQSGDTTATTDAAADDPKPAFDSPAPVQTEQFGDFDYSLGLGDPQEDEVEQAVVDAGNLYNQYVTQSPQQNSPGFSNTTYGAFADAVGASEQFAYGVAGQIGTRQAAELMLGVDITDITQGESGPAEYAVRNAFSGVLSVGNLPRTARDAGELAEFGVAGARAVNEGEGEEFAERTGAAGQQVAQNAAEDAQQDPIGFTAGGAGSLLGGFAAGRLGGRALRKATGGRVGSGSDLTGRIILGGARRVGFRQVYDGPLPESPDSSSTRVDVDDLPDEIAGTDPEDVETFRMEPDADRTDSPRAVREERQDRVEREAGERGGRDRSRDAAFQRTQNRPGTVADRVEYDRRVPSDDLRRLDALERSLARQATRQTTLDPYTSALVVANAQQTGAQQPTGAGSQPPATARETADQVIDDESLTDFFGSSAVTADERGRDVVDEQIQEESVSDFFATPGVRSDDLADVQVDTQTDVGSRTDSRADSRQDSRQDTRQDARTDTRSDVAQDVRQRIDTDTRFDLRLDTETRQQLRVDFEGRTDNDLRSDFDDESDSGFDMSFPAVSGPTAGAAQDAAYVPGFLAETFSDIATQGQGGFSAPSQATLAGFSDFADLTNSLPTDEYLSDDPQTQESLEQTEALFSFRGDSSDNQGGFFSFGGFF